MTESLTAIFSTPHILQIATVILVTFAAQLVARRVVKVLVRRAVPSSKFDSKREEVLREDTLISIIYTSSSVLIWSIAVLLILSILGLNVITLLAGAGFVGIALGFGAQAAIKDFMAGIFILSENQFRVGDVVQINRDVAGTVESLSLRMTVLRDLQGRVHYIPNGTIEIASNLTMGYAKVELNINIDYSSDIDKVEKVINQVGERIFADDKWKDIVLEAPRMLRVDAFGEYAIVIKVIAKTAPIRQWEVKSEILRKIKLAFDKEGIEIPMPQRVVRTKSNITSPATLNRPRPSPPQTTIASKPAQPAPRLASPQPPRGRLNHIVNTKLR